MEFPFLSLHPQRRAPNAGASAIGAIGLAAAKPAGDAA
jgi:hypothetical protein